MLLSNCETKQNENESVGAWRVQIVFKCISLIPPCGASRPRFACCWGYRGAWETHGAGRETSCPTFCIVLRRSRDSSQHWRRRVSWKPHRADQHWQDRVTDRGIVAILLAAFTF